MRLQMHLPEVKPGEHQMPTRCPYEECGGEYFKAHQQTCQKSVVDTDFTQVKAKRYKCLTCNRTFRVYPQGVSSAHRSERLRGIGVMLYVLGLSYGGTADALSALGWPGSKSSVYRDVQAAGEGVQRLRAVRAERKVQVLGADTTFVTCNKQQVTLGVGVDALEGDVLTIEVLDAESIEALRPFIEDLVAVFEVEVLLSDDQDTYKTIADENALRHSVCRAHVNRNAAKLVGELGTRALERPDPQPPGVYRSVEQFLADLEYFQWVIALRPSDGADQLRRLYQHYRLAPAPREGEKATMWYRFRLALLKWWDNWSRLTLDHVWTDQEADKPLDGTNNVTERAIGWWIKERYRTMRTYKRLQSVLNVSHVITYLGAHSGDVNLAEVLAA
jgi:transposase-like protein